MFHPLMQNYSHHLSGLPLLLFPSISLVTTYSSFTPSHDMFKDWIVCS